MTREEQRALAIVELRMAGYTSYLPNSDYFYEQIRTADAMTVAYRNYNGLIRGPNLTSERSLREARIAMVSISEAPTALLVEFAKHLSRWQENNSMS